MLRERECTSLLNHWALFRFVLCVVLFTQPREGDVCGYGGFCFSLSPPLFFFFGEILCMSHFTQWSFPPFIIQLTHEGRHRSTEGQRIEEISMS